MDTIQDARYNRFIMIQLQITTTEDTTLFELLEKAFPGTSKTKIKKFFQQNRIMRNQFLTTKDTNLKKAEEVIILKKPNFANDLLVYYEDKDIIVVEKPAYLLSVDADNNPGHSVHASLKRKYGQVFPVQRLDKETTGVMVFALTRAAKDFFWKQFEEKKVKRTYLSIAYGSIKEQKGVWRSFLLEGKDKKMTVNKKGKEAITHFLVKKRIKNAYTYLRCRLETGRKNQIRIHASSVGHPLVGDSRYGSDKKGKPLYLHAHELSFTHPRTKKNMSFISPIPNHFRKIVI